MKKLIFLLIFAFTVSAASASIVTKNDTIKKKTPTITVDQSIWGATSYLWRGLDYTKLYAPGERMTASYMTSFTYKNFTLSMNPISTVDGLYQEFNVYASFQLAKNFSLVYSDFRSFYGVSTDTLNQFTGRHDYDQYFKSAHYGEVSAYVGNFLEVGTYVYYDKQYEDLYKWATYAGLYYPIKVNDNLSVKPHVGFNLTENSIYGEKLGVSHYTLSVLYRNFEAYFNYKVNSLDLADDTLFGVKYVKTF